MIFFLFTKRFAFGRPTFLRAGTDVLSRLFLFRNNKSNLLASGTFVRKAFAAVCPPWGMHFIQVRIGEFDDFVGHFVYTCIQ